MFKKFIIIFFITTIFFSSAYALELPRDFSRDKNGYCVFINTSEKKLYVIKENIVQYSCDIMIGLGGPGKTKAGDWKTPLGDYKIKWMVSRNGSKKENSGGLSSFVINGQTYAVLDTWLYFGDPGSLRVKVLSDGTKIISQDINDRPISQKELLGAQEEKLWTDAYGGKNVFVMALDYPNAKDRKEGKTGDCIQIHASANLEAEGSVKFRGTFGCVAMMPEEARKVYEYVNPGTPVRIE